MFEKQCIGERAKAGDRRIGGESKSAPEVLCNPAQEITTARTHTLLTSPETGVCFRVTYREELKFEGQEREAAILCDPRVVRAESL